MISSNMNGRALLHAWVRVRARNEGRRLRRHFMIVEAKLAISAISVLAECTDGHSRKSATMPENTHESGSTTSAEPQIGDHFWARFHSVGSGRSLVMLMRGADTRYRSGPKQQYFCAGDWEGSYDRSEFEVIAIVPFPAGYTKDDIDQLAEVDREVWSAS